MSGTRIYFIANHAKNAVKIGVADNPKARLSNLQTGCLDELSILAEMPGDEHYEKALHRAFDEFALRGEWFRLEGRLEQFVSLLPDFPTPKRMTARDRKVALPQPRRANKRAVEKHWQEMLVLLREAVDFIGADQCAAAFNTSRGNLMNALYERHNRHFHMKWLCILFVTLPPDRTLVLLNHIMLPTGYAVRTDEQIEADRVATERLERLKARVVETFGEEGRAWLAMIDAEIEETERRARDEREAYWYAPDTLGEANR